MSPAVVTEKRDPAHHHGGVKRLLLGDPLTSETADEQLLPKRRALPIFASEYAAPIARFIHEYRQKFGSSVVTVYLPQYIVGHWWESFLHNRRARRVAGQLMLVHGVTITIVPWLLDSSDLVYGRRSRAVPGQDRAGMPTPAGRAPVPRAPASIRRDYGDGTPTR